MKNSKHSGWGLLLVAAATLAVSFASCERRPLEEAYSNTARIPLGVVWSKANINPQNVTVLFYNQADGQLATEHTYENNSKRIQSYVDLPIGIYTVVAFNELRDQISSVGVRGYDNLNTLDIYAKQDPAAKTRAQTDRYIASPGIFASTVVRNFVVSANLVDYTRDRLVATESQADLLSQSQLLIGLTPLRKMSEIKIVMHIKGLNNARMPALIDLRNLSSSYLVNTDRNSGELSTHQFTMNNRTYDAGSTKDGTISASLTVFGVVGNRLSSSDQPLNSPILIDALFQLVDAERTVVNRTLNITDAIRFSTHDNGTIVIEVQINLPDPLPYVLPEGSKDGSGFDSELTNWEVVEVPLIA